MLRFSTLPARTAFTRSFRTLAPAKVHFAEGPYTNLPFKVHNRKIPFGLVFFSFFGLGFAVPLIATVVQLDRGGAFNKTEE